MTVGPCYPTYFDPKRLVDLENKRFNLDCSREFVNIKVIN